MKSMLIGIDIVSRVLRRLIMRIIQPSFLIINEINGTSILKKIETAGRICYKSEDKITDSSAKTFAESLIQMGHESVIEHESISVKIVCDRGVSHEIVRHRIASFSQESTRYCNYSQDRFGNGLTFIKPCFWDETSECYLLWEEEMKSIERKYFQLLSLGATPQQIRSILPNSLKTEIYITMNLREWRHFFKLRTCPSAHPQMQEISIPLLKKFRELIPIIFDDILVG